MDKATITKRLDEERSRLQRVRDGLAEETQATGAGGADSSELSSIDQHPADVGTEEFEREKDLSILEQVEAELADVEHALRRLDEGTYGTCEVCGKTIPDERLEAMPAARLCLEHQAEAEREVRFSGERADVGPGQAPGLE